MNESNRSDELLAALYDAQLPASIPILTSYDLAARFLLPPAHTEPAGAWFDVIPLSQERVALVVGDVVDTGVVGAATVGQVRAVLRTALADREEAGQRSSSRRSSRAAARRHAARPWSLSFWTRRPDP